MRGGGRKRARWVRAERTERGVKVETTDAGEEGDLENMRGSADRERGRERERAKTGDGDSEAEWRDLATRLGSGTRPQGVTPICDCEAQRGALESRDGEELQPGGRPRANLTARGEGGGHADNTDATDDADARKR